jgi:TonB family protein
MGTQDGQESSFLFTNWATSQMRVGSWQIIRAIRNKTPKLRRPTTASLIKIAKRHSRVLATLRRRSVVLLIGLASLVGEASAEWKPSKIESFHYPMVARAAGIQGVVVLSCTIDANGAISAASVVSGNPLLSQAAIEAIKAWKFSQTGSFAQSPLQLTIEFHLEGRCKDECCPEKSEKFVFRYPDRVLLTSKKPPIDVSRSKSQKQSR